MKIIDLLNKIANGEEVPEKIKVNEIIFEYQGDDYLFKDKNNYNKEHWLFSDGYTDKFQWLDIFLTTEIEIIEEPKKIETNLKKMLIPSIQFNLGYINTNDKEVVIKEMNKTIQDLYDRTLALNTQINEIIDYINNKYEN